MSQNNLNSNNFLLGVVKNKENNNSDKKPSDSLLNHLKVLENESIKESNSRNNSKSSNYPSIETVVNELIQKLENDVFVLNNKIKSFNTEKKAIIELDKKEIDNLKSIIRKLYILILTINKTIKPNRNMNLNNKKTLIETIRTNLESSKGFLKTVDDIMSENGEQSLLTTNKDERIFSTNISNNNTKISSIFLNHLKKNQEKEEEEKKEIINNVFNNKNSNNNSIKTITNNINGQNLNKSNININGQNLNKRNINGNNNGYISNITQKINNSGITNIVFEKEKKNKKYDILKKKISNTEISKNEAKESLSKYFLQ